MSHAQLPHDDTKGTDKPQRVSPYHDLEDFDSHVDSNLPPVTWTALLVSAALTIAVLTLVTFIA